MKAIICIAGGIASGKTTLAQALTKALPTSTARSFGSVVRTRAQAEGLPTDRVTLQDVGLRLIAEGWTAFVDDVLMDLPSSADILIVDGIRHREALEEVQRRFPGARHCLVYLEADQAAVRRRLAERRETVMGLKHGMEREIPDLAVLADLKADTSLRPIDTAVDYIMKRLDLRPTGTE